MAIVLFPRSGLQAQSQRSLRRGHWSTDGLQAIYAGFQEHSGVLTLEEVQSLLRDSSGTSGGGVGGRRFNAVSEWVRLGGAWAPNRAAAPTDRVTLLYMRRKHDATNRDAIHVGVSFTDASRLMTHCPFTDGVVYWDFGGNSSPNRLTASGLGTQGIQKWAFVAGTRGSSIYLDGVRRATQASAITRTAGNNFGINGNVLGTQGDLQDVYLVAVYNVEWTPSMIAEWSVDPWLMFSQPESPVGLPVAPPVSGLSFRPLLVSP
jgi:hypothetical protein